MIIPKKESDEIEFKPALNNAVIETLVAFSNAKGGSVSIQGRYFKRVDASNHLLSANEVANMHLQTINSSWDYYPRPNKTINDISFEKVRKIMNTIKKRNENFQFETEIEFLEKNELLL